MSEQNQDASRFTDGGLQSQDERNTESDSATNQNPGIITHRRDGTLDYNDELRTPYQQ